MPEQIFFNSPYKFTDPIRYFKANDPYFYKVDNIPLEQLEENVLFVKSQVESLITNVSGELNSIGAADITRSRIAELKPYVDGTNNVVKVKPGRFSARINDAYNIHPLQIITQVDGISFPNPNLWTSKSLANETLRNTIELFQDIVFFGGMNGLAERVYQYPISDTDTLPTFITDNNPVMWNGFPYPNYTGMLWWNKSTQELIYLHNELPDIYASNGVFFQHGWAAADFIKRWRGVTRTAIVDIPNELEIEIPDFDENDFYYINENGVKTLISANHRIDLVFIYSKAIDVSSTTISKFTNGVPRTITAPALGVVRGAGIGINFQRITDSGPQPVISLFDSEGNARILANPGDENAANTGIGSIKGSFPSPDDLMNITPLLSENLETNNYSLIGQSILPVAYVIVRKTASTNSNGITIIDSSDLIDIRPFFRTTELSYNERAGIAAATPSLSLANPVATEAYVDYHVKNLYDDYVARVENSLNSVTTNPNYSRVIGAGYVKGGYNFGVEGALARQIELRYGITDRERLKSEVKTRYGFPQSQNIPDYPDWDMAQWCLVGNYPSKGSFPNDYINFHTLGLKGGSAGLNQMSLRCGPYSDNTLTSRVESLGTDRGTAGNDKGLTALYFVKKTIFINRENCPWLGDYHVDVQLLNCMPLSCRANRGIETQAAGGASIWVDKRYNEFTIFVSWVPKDHIDSQSLGSPNNLESAGAGRFPYIARNHGGEFAGFSVINQDFISWDNPRAITSGEVDVGVAIYPTIGFKIYGIPSGAQYLSTDLNINNPILVLS